MKHAICFLVAVALVRSPAMADDATDAGIQFFETKVRPVLVEHCYQCHGPDKQEGRLRLDSWTSMKQGGESGMAIVAGQPDQSLLVTAIRYQSEDLKMPPENKKLSDGQIKDLVQWVTIGAPYPDASPTTPITGGIDWPTAREFWAFQPPQDPPVPTVQDKSWAKSELDRFILAELERQNLKPAPPADPRTFIRRATFDLIGLPPTPEEIEAFEQESLRDPPAAIRQLIDRLLESPQYGIRWGRHWLDVARYADSNGLDENVAYGTAWRYRNYVIDAFNRDKPFDQFVVEQLAGDLLPSDDVATRHERLIATGFLSLGPKVLAEVDEGKMEMDIVDEQIDTVGRSFMALTFGCARCHNHKFDPILTQDYYALAGIFKSTRTMEHFKKIARWWENPIATADDEKRKADHEKQIADVKARVASLITQANEKLGQTTAAPDEAQFPEETKAELKRLRDELTSLEKSLPELPTALGVSDGNAADVAVHVRGSHLTLGAFVPRGFPTVMNDGQIAAPSASESGRLQLATWLVRPDHPLTSRVIVNRIWRWHFGAGLVPSTDNFGHLGDRPTNGPLLDWLARRFVEGGWSIKELHRTIMLSAVYQMSSESDPAAIEIDPENRLLWRANVRRLEAEAIRDSLLFVAGTLDPSIGQSMLHVKNREFLFDHTSKDETKYESQRRSIFLPVIRNNLYDVFSLFDYTDASMINGDRATSTVAPQALFMLNSPLVRDTALQLAAQLLAREGVDDGQRVDLLYQRAFGRRATDREVERAAKFLASAPAAGGQGDARLAAWQSLCHAVVASNEFIYVR